MAQRVSGVKVTVGFVSETGPRRSNEDYAGAVFGSELPKPRRDVVAAIADGIGSTKGGREAAEIAVRGFLDGFCDLPETVEVRRAAAIVLDAINGWIHSQGQRDPMLMGMGCTFTALVLRGRIAHVLHVGGTRAYRFSRDRLTCLTADHVRQEAGGRPRLRPRAGVGRARCRQRRQLYRVGARRGRPRDRAHGRDRRRHRATAADPGAAWRRDPRWFC